jgi:hypothetical protein
LLGAGFAGDVDGKRLRAPALISDRAGYRLGFARIDVGNSDCGAFGREKASTGLELTRRGVVLGVLY